MPVPTTVQHEKNIWVAAGDGDLERVRELIEVHSMSPNVPDPNTYTPMHAAASYGHINILEYLVSRGGDVNVTDNDGDTPLYVVENVETARWLVEHGATVNRQNDEGMSPAQYLEEDHPEVAAFLESLSGGGSGGNSGSTLASPIEMHEQPSQHAQNVASEHLTSSLIQDVQGIMERAEAEGREASDEELREVVGRAVLQGMVTGYGMSQDGAQGREERDGDAAKRSRTDGN
ncbi:ankyrin [Trametes coccinea BRFM310]|uniref:Ankyrin n=1 Tax=Trametes coccinea (strain BRFM310) TaxID=1353009 RepID=A0A1Y2J285_TRAC3|nr:ankyrin [Trametes coccinea BRFM310]